MTSTDTPLPLPKKHGSAMEPLGKKEIQSLTDGLIELFKQNHILMDKEAAECIMDKAVTNGRLVGSILDDFFQAAREAKSTFISRSVALQLLDKPFVSVQVNVLNCFKDIAQYRWDFQNQKYIEIEPNQRSLVPDANVYRAVFLHRYHKAANKLKRCQNVLWWSEVQAVQHMTLTSAERITVQPAQCAKGLKGFVSVFGVLRLVVDESLISQTWALEDGSQRYILDLSSWKPNGQLYLDSNMVVMSGTIDNATNTLHVTDVSHPPFDDDLNSEDLRFPTLNITCSPKELKPLLSGCSWKKHQWIVFGICHLDNNHVISNIYSALSHHDISHVAGIILTGEFSSKPFNIRSKDEYVKVFGELFDALKLWHNQFNSKNLGSLKVVLVPGKHDAGPRYFPKFPLLESMILTPFAEVIQSFQNFIDIVFASNPMWLEISHPSSMGGKKKCAVVCRTDLIRLVDVFQISPGGAFQQPLQPTAEELISAIPPLIAGQSHLYPVPFRSPHVLHSAVGFDHMLELFSLPSLVILSDHTVPYATYWQQRFWFCSPGQIADKSYLVLNLLNESVEIREVLS